MDQRSRSYRLAETIGSGVSCDETGCFVGGTPLLERPDAVDAPARWRPCPLSALNIALSDRYGLPVDLASKMAGLAAVARALDLGDIVRAKIVTLHLQLPDPPPVAKASGANDILGLARRLQASEILDKTWDATKHPRWPAQSPGSVGGQFAPAGDGALGATAAAAPPTSGRTVQHARPPPSGDLTDAKAAATLAPRSGVVDRNRCAVG